ncbi:MAG: ATP-binding protein [bacterium]|nr:ATP-binding protein [bacterium]
MRASQRSETVQFRRPSHDLPDLLADPGGCARSGVNAAQQRGEVHAGRWVHHGKRQGGPHLADEVSISVRDSGCGIPPEEQERISDISTSARWGPEIGRGRLGQADCICRRS